MPGPFDLFVAALVVATAAALQGSVGFGFAVISSPALALIHPTLAPIPVLILGLPLSIGTVVRERGHVMTKGLGWVILGRLPGAALGVTLLSLASDRVLGIVIGTVVLVAVAGFSRGVRIALSPPTQFGAGVVSGFSGASSAIGGPPIALLYSSNGGAETRSTLGTIFTIGITINILALGAFGLIDMDHLRSSAILTVPLIVGFSFSTRIKHLFEGRTLRTSILVVSALAGTALLVTSSIG